MEIPYSSRSRFFHPIEKAIGPGEDFRRPLAIDLGAGGYEREVLVVLREEDPFMFGTNWRAKDPSRFSARIRAAATVLRTRGYRGRFWISHREGVLVVHRPAD